MWLPNWPLQRAVLARPELKSRPLTLYAKHRGGLRVVTSTTYAAGTPLAEVTIGRVEPHDPHADQQALLQLAAWCERFSPCVGVEPPDNLCFDVSGLEALFGSDDRLAQLVAQSLQRLGVKVRLAVAATLGAAWALAHFGPPLVIAPAHELAINDLPIAGLRLGNEIELLAELGVESIGQLLAIPREALASRFGPPLLLRLAQATGEVSEPIISHRPPPEIILEHRWEEAVEHRQAVELILRELIARIAVALAQRQQGALRIACELDCEGRPVRFVIGLYRASAKASHLFELAQMQLDRATLPAPVASAKLSVLLSAPLHTWQPELFESSRREDCRQIRQLVDRLSNRLGREAVVRAMPLADAQPELAVWYEPLTGAPTRKTKQRWKPLPRPLRLEREPMPLEVTSVTPHGPPIRFYWCGLHTVVHHRGPERIQTGWWRGRYIQRDYYRVETETGKRFWLFRNLPDRQWFLHGVFD